MHAGRKRVVILFWGLLIMCLGFAWAAFRDPHWFFAVFLVLWLLAAGFAAYRAFGFSDDWYQEQENAKEQWYVENPRVGLLVNILVVACFVWQVVLFVRHFLY